MNKLTQRIIAGMMLFTFGVSNTMVASFAITGQGETNTIKLRADVSNSKLKNHVSLSLRESDVKQVLRMFADKAGMNIIFDKNVSGTVTLDLVDVPLSTAFDLVLGVSGLNYVTEGNTIVISSSSSPSTIGKQEITLIPVKYIDASALAQFLNQNIFSMQKPGISNTDVVTSNPLTNELLVMGNENDAALARKIVEKFDKKPISTTIKVNHTTPEQMANLVCSTLIPATSSSGNGADSNEDATSTNKAKSGSKSTKGTTNDNQSPIQKLMTGGAASISGVPTGFASSSSSLDSESKSSGGTKAVELGGGTVACTVTPLATGKLSSVPLQSLSVTYFTQLGTIGIMGGSQAQQDMIKEFIAEHDKKQPQAYLEVAILELNESGSKTLSNTWNFESRNFSFRFDPDSGSSTIAAGTGDGTVALHYAMNYIIENGKGRVVANPRILITNGQESIIDLTSDYVKTANAQVVTSSVSTIPTVQRTYEIGDDQGIKVNITPFISPDGYVTLNIMPNYSTYKGEETYPMVINEKGDTEDILAATLLQRRNLDLKNVRIKDGETLVIGGMITEVDKKTVKKIPFLGDIPGLGLLFRYSNSEKEKAELVIMITPKIIVDAEETDNNNML